MEPSVQATGKSLSDAAMADLFIRIREGDASALIGLYEGTSHLVFGLIIRILGEGASAEEVLLDVYTNVWKQSSSFDPRVAPLPQLIAVARNTALARSHWSKINTQKAERSGPGAAAAPTVAPEQQKLARSRLDSVTPAERELLEKAYYSGLSCTELAAQAGKPLGAVKSQLRTGLSKLTESLARKAGSVTAAAVTAEGGKIEA